MTRTKNVFLCPFCKSDLKRLYYMYYENFVSKTITLEEKYCPKCKKILLPNIDIKYTEIKGVN